MKKNELIIIVAIAVFSILVFYYIRNKKKVTQESNFKLRDWIKFGGCRPCVGSSHDGCCGGCICADAHRVTHQCPSGTHYSTKQGGCVSDLN